MGLFDHAVRTSNITSANAAYELKGSTTDRTRLFEIGFTLVTAVATNLGLGRPAAAGITPTSPVTFLGEDVNDTSAATDALAWATSPTAPTYYFRRWSGSAIGQGAVWVFPRGLPIEKTGANNSLVLFNILGGATLDVYIVISD